MDAQAALKVDSTAYLREKLGFLDDAEWKRFSNRRLELINLLKLDEQKASQQEPQIHQVAVTVAAEFGYPAHAVADFERLVRLGIQSARRNRRRPTKAGIMTTTTFELDGPSWPSSQLIEQGGLLKTLCDLSSGEQCPENALAVAGALRLAMGLALPNVGHSPLAQLMLQGFESGALGDELSRAIGHSSICQALSTACARDAGATINVLASICKELSTTGDLSEMIKWLDCAEVQIKSIWWPGQAQGHNQNLSVGQSQSQSQSQPQKQTQSQSQTQQPPSKQILPQRQPPNFDLPLQLPISHGPMWADRNVTISFGDKQLQFTFSPLKGSPPGVQEILDTCRSSFGIKDDKVLRIRTSDTQKIIDTNADLADAFLCNKLDLEIFLP